MLLVCLAACAFAGRQVIILEDHSPRDLSTAMKQKIQIVNGDAVIPNVGAAHDLVSAALEGTPSPKPNPDRSNCAAIIHLVQWKPDKVNDVPQAASSHWYVYSGAKGWDQDALAQNNRIFGIRHVLLMYVYLNLPAGFNQFPWYQVEATSKIPAPLRDLFLVSSAFTAEAVANAKFGVAAFDVPELPSDLSVTAGLATPNPSGVESVTTTGTAQSFDDEGRYFVDFSIGIPLRKMSEAKFDNTNNTVSPATVDKRTMFALIDLYPFRKDVKSTGWDWRPYGVAGLGIGSQPLHRILVAVGWGPKFAQFYVGALFSKQESLATLQAGATATPAQQAADARLKYGTQFAFGINIPVARALASLAGGKNN
jgi:hypothetical protein